MAHKVIQKKVVALMSFHHLASKLSLGVLRGTVPDADIRKEHLRAILCSEIAPHVVARAPACT